MPPELNFEVISLANVPLDRKFLAPIEKRQRTVLVVDDEHVIADTLSIILKKSGFQVLTAYDAESALVAADKETPDLLLSDVMMSPGMDGIQLAVQIVQKYPDCKVLLFSGHAATSDLLAKARQDGHNFTLITKPVHPTDLLKRIAEKFLPSQQRAASAP